MCHSLVIVEGTHLAIICDAIGAAEICFTVLVSELNCIPLPGAISNSHLRIV